MSYYPGYEEIAAVHDVDLKRFEPPRPARVLPATAHRSAAPPPPDPEVEQAVYASQNEIHTITRRVRTPGPALGIASFPKGKRGKAVQRRDKATCPHEDGWIRNGKGTTPGTIRVQCRACELNRQALK